MISAMVRSPPLSSQSSSGDLYSSPLATHRSSGNYLPNLAIQVNRNIWGSQSLDEFRRDIPLKNKTYKEKREMELVTILFIKT